MKTAPTDGTEIFANLYEDYAQTIFAVPCSSDLNVFFWKSLITGRFVTPTHWVPAPAPPSFAAVRKVEDEWARQYEEEDK